jgi:hypothetical protein
LWTRDLEDVARMMLGDPDEDVEQVLTGNNRESQKSAKKHDRHAKTTR